MKKIIFLLSFLALNLYFSQTNNVLKLKFNERYFLSNMITNKTNNAFILNVFKKIDSISDKQKNRNYIVIMDSILKNGMILQEKEKLNYTASEQKAFDSLKVEIDNGNFLKLMKKAVQVNFDSEFLEKSFVKSDIKNFKINQSDYNTFSIAFSDKENLAKTKTLFLTQRLFFHESIGDKDLEEIQDCFMKENDTLVKNNYLKIENNYLLIYKDDANLFGHSYKNSKCFNSKKITFVLNNGEDYEVFSKLFFVKESNKLENNLVKSIRGFDIVFKKNQNSYNDNNFYLTFYLDDFGKDYLKQISEQNIGKKIFISSESEFLLDPKISTKLENGSFKLNGNLFEVKWQELYELAQFEVFKNSLTIQ